MTIEEKIAEFFEQDIDYRQGVNLTNEEAALAARCIRAVLEAAKEENWDVHMTYQGDFNTDYSWEKDQFNVYKVSPKLDHGYEFFQHVITGANEHG